MNNYHKWEALLSDNNKRNEWLEYYQRADPMFGAVMEFCEQKDISEKASLELALIAVLDQKFKTLTEKEKMVHDIKRPLPSKLVEGEYAYPEDLFDLES